MSSDHHHHGSPRMLVPESEQSPNTPSKMTPQQIQEKFVEQRLYESPIKWISASKRMTGDWEIAERKAELAVKSDRDLTREWTNQDRERQDYLQQVKKKIHTFKVSLDSIRNKLSDRPGTYDKPAPDNLENLLENFESKVAAFKLNMKTEFDQLEQSEEFLMRDIMRVDQLIQNITEDEHHTISPEKESKLMKTKLQQQQKQQQQFEEDMEHKAAIGEVDREVRKPTLKRVIPNLISFHFSFENSWQSWVDTVVGTLVTTMPSCVSGMVSSVPLS
jgi:chromosome segregation ATPase